MHDNFNKYKMFHNRFLVNVTNLLLKSIIPFSHTYASFQDASIKIRNNFVQTRHVFSNFTFDRATELEGTGYAHDVLEALCKIKNYDVAMLESTLLRCRRPGELMNAIYGTVLRV